MIRTLSGSHCALFKYQYDRGGINKTSPLLFSKINLPSSLFKHGVKMHSDS